MKQENDMRKQLGFTAPEAILVTLILAGFIGWILNIVAIVHTCCEPITGMLAIRIIGIFIAPLGAVLGYF